MTAHEPDEPRDFLARCVPATTGNPVLEEVRDRSSNAVLAVYRLLKTGIVHAADNQALHQTVEQSHAIIQEFTAAVGAPLAITFAANTAFANGQLVRASRRIYELIWDLQRLLQRCDASEVVFEPEVGPTELLRLAVTTAQTLREASQRDGLLRAEIPHVRVRRIDPVLVRRERDEELEIRERILRFYASALLVMRKFFDEVAQGVVPLPHRIKRVAQRLVTLAEAGDPTMLGLMTMIHAHRDDAGRALQAAILAVALGRELTNDRVSLARIALAALMADAGRVRLAGSAGRDRLVPLGDEDEAAVPAMTSAVNLATGGVNPPAALRTVLGHEATWLEREELLGPLHGRELPPLLASRLLRLVRAVLDRLAPRDTSLPLAPMDAIAAAAALPDGDPVLLRLLVRALGIIPVGTVVEFETGEWAVVVAASSHPEAFDRPQVKLLTDRQGRALEQPKLVDLGASSGARVHPRISHILPPANTKFNVTRAFVT
jgi:hypothetical protein